MSKDIEAAYTLTMIGREWYATSRLFLPCPYTQGNPEKNIRQIPSWGGGAAFCKIPDQDTSKTRGV